MFDLELPPGDNRAHIRSVSSDFVLNVLPNWHLHVLYEHNLAKHTPHKAFPVTPPCFNMFALPVHLLRQVFYGFHRF